MLYGITYVDHVKRTVFNGSGLGKAYSAKAILVRCAKGVASEEKNKVGEVERVAPGRVAKGDPPSVNFVENSAGEGKNTPALGLVETLLQPGEQPEVMDWQLKRKKRKKKRQHLPPV